MADVQPFRAVTYDTRRAGPIDSLLALPYDVIGPDELDRYRALSPYNVVRLILPDDPHDAARLYREWLDEGILRVDDTPALWWLRQEYTGPDGVRRTREGIAGSVRVEPYERGVIRPHERTHDGPRLSQLALLRATRVSLSPIFFVYDDAQERAHDALAGAAGGPPLVEARDGDVLNRLWRVDDPVAVAEASAALADAQLVIADGHHRYEAALALAEEDPSAQRTLGILVNARSEGLTIFPTHRVVRRVPEVNGAFRVTDLADARTAFDALEALRATHPAFVLYRGGRAQLVEAPDADALDTAVLDSLGVEVAAYTPRLEEAVALVDAGEAEGAFLLRAPRFEDVAAVAAAGETMPQKSTYFYPKLLSGLLFHPV